MPANLSVSLIEILGAPIVQGESVPGRILPTERELSAHYGVSRTVVREAVKMLSAKGLVESRPKRGIRVREREDWNSLDPDVLKWAIKDAAFFEDLAEFRQLVEPAAAELAARRSTKANSRRLLNLCSDMEKAESDRHHTAFNQADQRFHDEIVQIAGNGLLRHVFKLIKPLVRLNFESTLHLLSTAPSSAPLHRSLAEAIAAHQPEKARWFMESIIDQAKANALRLDLSSRHADSR